MCLKNLSNQPINLATKNGRKKVPKKKCNLHGFNDIKFILKTDTVTWVVRSVVSYK